MRGLPIQGNGLRADIWRTFVSRFNLSEIGEFYGSTEGNVAFFNHHHAGEEDSVGAIGRQGWLLHRLMGWRLVRFDMTHERPFRRPSVAHTTTPWWPREDDEDQHGGEGENVSHGFCEDCKVGEPGELLGLIGTGPRAFRGYLGNKKATEKKILHSAFRTGGTGDNY